MEEDNEPKTERIITPMSVSLLDRIDEWRHANRLASRAEAMRQLIEWALDNPKFAGSRPKSPARRKK